MVLLFLFFRKLLKLIIETQDLHQHDYLSKTLVRYLMEYKNNVIVLFNIFKIIVADRPIIILAPCDRISKIASSNFSLSALAESLGIIKRFVV